MNEKGMDDTGSRGIDPRFIMKFVEEIYAMMEEENIVF